MIRNSSSIPICWIYLKPSNMKHTKDFYKEVLGWTYKAERIFNRNHTIIYANGYRVDGLSDLSAPIYPPGINPHLSMYLEVADSIRVAEKSVGAGGKVLIDPFNWDIINNQTIVHNRIEIGEIQQSDMEGERSYWEVGFRVNTMTDTLNRALSRGATNLGHAVSHDGRKMIRISDPDGIVFSIIEKTR